VKESESLGHNTGYYDSLKDLKFTETSDWKELLTTGKKFPEE
jgi:hypothetical protein